ncbi:sulfite exporter TauE/SafE family protein [Nitrosopumilus sp. S4]
MIDYLIGILQDSNPFLVIGAGLIIGLLHSFEPDHLSAISTQIQNNHKSRNSKLELKSLTIRSTLRGIMWGMGHTSSIIVIGLLIVGLSLNISEKFFLSAEIVVGFMLIILGILTFSNRNFLKHKHIHPHEHSNGVSHIHNHSHKGDHNHEHRSYLIGCVHGIAGSGSLIALIVSTMNGFEMMIYFLILFCIGSIMGMSLASGFFGLSFIIVSKINLASKYLRCVIASLTFIIGINIVLSIGFDGKLFLLG